MRIMPINKQPAMKGLRINDPKLVEARRTPYRPYCWELPTHCPPYSRIYNFTRGIRMDEPVRIGAIDSGIPNNEFLLYPDDTLRDLFGTRTYCQWDCVMVNDPFSREESLKIYSEKCKRFIDYKDRAALAILQNTIPGKVTDLGKTLKGVFRAKEGLLMDNPLKESVEYFKQKDTISRQLYWLQSSIETTSEIFSTRQRLEDNIKEVNKELDIIHQAKASDSYIDISKRNSSDPNKPLWIYIDKLAQQHGMEGAREKISSGEAVISLPHETLKLKELYEKAMEFVKTSSSKTKEFPKLLFDYVDNRIMLAKYF